MRHRRSSTLSTALTCGAVIGLFAMMAIVWNIGCASLASQATARHALEVQGFRSIQYRGRHGFAGFHGCSEKDVARFDYTAVNPIGRTVSVYVCEGWPFKGATIRYP